MRHETFSGFTSLVPEPWTEEDARALRAIGGLPDGAVATFCPVTAQDAMSGAFRHILEVYKGLPDNFRHVVGLDGEVDTSVVRAIYGKIPEEILDRTLIVWNGGARVAPLRSEIEVSFGHRIIRKGGNVFTMIGVGKALGVKSGVFHDGDIVNFGPRFVSRLLDPLVRPTRRKEFTKADFRRVGFKAPQAETPYGADFESAIRQADPGLLKLNARGCRLLAKPLFRAAAGLYPEWRSLHRMGSFGYPLSGEFGADMEALLQLELGSNFSLETVMAADFGEDRWRRKVEEVDLGLYEHKHSSDLTDMSRQIIEALIGLIAPNSERFLERLGELPIRYETAAEAALNYWGDFAAGHRISWEETQERLMILRNRDLLAQAVRDTLATGRPPKVNRMPSWTNVQDGLPHVPIQLLEAALADRQQLLGNGSCKGLIRHL
jgi:hypothetical protein